MTSAKDQEERESEKTRKITEIKQLFPDNNDYYGVEIRMTTKNKTSLLTPALRLPSCQTTQQGTKWKISD